MERRLERPPALEAVGEATAGVTDEFGERRLDMLDAADGFGKPALDPQHRNDAARRQWGWCEALQPTEAKGHLLAEAGRKKLRGAADERADCLEARARDGEAILLGQIQRSDWKGANGGGLSARRHDRNIAMTGERTRCIGRAGNHGSHMQPRPVQALRQAKPQRRLAVACQLAAVPRAAA